MRVAKCNEKLSHYPNIVKDSEFRRFLWSGDITRMRRQGMHTEFLLGNLLENYHLEDRERDGRITLR
jgi:hypothetical protein